MLCNGKGKGKEIREHVMIITDYMQSKYTQKQLRIAIASEKIQDRTLYYSLAQKEQKNLSFMKNERLLLLDFDDGRLYYVNQTKNLPFKTQVPPPKNEFAIVESTTWLHAANSNEIEFTFPYNKEKTVWKFVFESGELADEWVKMIEFQKYSTSVKERDMKALNKAIFEMPTIEKQHANDIVKEPQRNIANDESRILNHMMGGSKPLRSDPPQDYRNDRTRSKKWTDWNQRFYQERNVLTLYEFEQAALDSFYKTVPKDDHRQDKVRSYQGESLNIQIANRFTLNAKKLKIQFRNYQFILQATSKKFIVGVPLACLIEFENLVALVKASFPEKVEAYAYDNTIKDQLHQLERYTRVKNRVLEFGSIILGLGKFYEQNSRMPLFYLDNLMEYLPVNTEFPQELTLIRPEYMLDHVDYFVFSGPSQKIGKTELRQLRELGLHVADASKTFSNRFYLESFPVVRITQLKNILHEQGLNLKFLPFVYNNCSNLHVKKYIYTSMTAKIVKDYIYETIAKLRLNDDSVSLVKVVEETFSILLQGNNNKSNELWKEISLIFKRKFNIVLNHREIIPGFFFNSILQLVPCSYDLRKLNKGKKIFEEMRIIQPGFLKDLLPKVKSYYKFLPEGIEALKFEAKQYIKSQETSKKILNQLFNPKDKKYESFYRFANNDEWMIDYLSLYYPPENIASQGDDRINFLYDRINEEPPSFFTMNLTKSYLEWCNKKENTEEFKIVFEKAMGIADYWLEEIHPIRSDLFEILSDYFSILGINEDMIRYMKDSLTICVKFWGNNSIQAGLKQYQLADRYLRAGKKKESLDNFYKAKDNMELNKTKTNKHGLSLMKLASIYLSELDYEKALEFAQQSIKSFEDYEKKVNSNGIYNEPYKIKSFEILARIYEICDRRSQYKDLALSCARKFNQTKNRDVFQQMMRICLASAIFKSNNDRCTSFLKLVQSIVGDGRQLGNPQISLEDLMRMSDDIIVMQRFVFKYEQFQRSLFQLNLKKRQLGEDSQEFITILKAVINVVGYEYIKGLIDEKISCTA